MSDAEGQVALDRLKSEDANRRREAAQGLADAQPDPSRRAAVAEALETALNDHEERVQREALRALGVWGDRTSARALIDRCKDRSFNPWREALGVLARLDPSPRTAEILIGRMPEDYGHVLRLLSEMGAVAEPAILQAFQTAPDLRVRVESCRVLEAIGTEASLSVLQAAAAHTGDGVVAAAADDALRGISERE
jgi:HEAT repeat protein